VFVEEGGGMISRLSAPINY